MMSPETVESQKGTPVTVAARSLEGASSQPIAEGAHVSMCSLPRRHTEDASGTLRHQRPSLNPLRQPLVPATARFYSSLLVLWDVRCFLPVSLLEVPPPPFSRPTAPSLPRR